MLCEMFYKVIQMSVFASVLAIVLISIKYVLQKLGCPKKIMFLLWGVIAFRLICPVAPSTDLSTLNVIKLISPAVNKSITVENVVANPGTVIHYDTDKQEVYNAVSDATADGRNLAEIFVSALWLLGICVMFIYGVTSYFILKICLKFAVRLKDNVYISDNIHTPFVLGLFRPKVYIPENVSEQNLSNAVLHEETHIKRGDHISKIVGYIILSLHWFNPIVWVLFKLFSEDMEFSCDESIISVIGHENKKQYLDSLLQAATNKKRTMFFCNVCFSSNPTKRRVKNLIDFKKSSKLLSVVAALLCVLLLLAFR